jgi:hypothetical protein
MKHCKDCKHFTDAHYNRTYISPVCLVHGGDDAAFMRQYICTLDAKLFQAKKCQQNASEAEQASEIERES